MFSSLEIAQNLFYVGKILVIDVKEYYILGVHLIRSKRSTIKLVDSKQAP